jgi:DNA-directed RNA polymerase subunit M/transcription elongation factor TFIIS
MSSQKIKFCPKCDNKYYHQVVFDSEEEDKLIYFCRVCGHQDDDDITGTCVLNIQYDEKNKTRYENIINKYTKYDPTLPHINIPCPNIECKSNQVKENDSTVKHTDAIYIRYDHENMKHLYMCIECEYVWKTHEI